MRTTLLGSNLGFRPRRSPGAMTVRPTPPGSFTVATPNADTKRIPASTRRPSMAWIGVARGGRGAPNRSSRQFVASDASTAAGRHRRISVRLMISQATERYGAGSILSRPRSDSLGVKMRAGESRTADRRRTKPGPMADQKRTDTGCASKKTAFENDGEPRTQDGWTKGRADQTLRQGPLRPRSAPPLRRDRSGPQCDSELLRRVNEPDCRKNSRDTQSIALRC